MIWERNQREAPEAFEELADPTQNKVKYTENRLNGEVAMGWLMGHTMVYNHAIAIRNRSTPPSTSLSRITMKSI